MSAALEALEQQAGEALEGAAEEYARVKRRLKRTERAVAALDKELSETETDTVAIASAYDKAQTELSATQEAMARLLAAVVGELNDPSGF